MNEMRTWLPLAVLPLALSTIGACTDSKGVKIGLGEPGESCSQVSDCKAGLTCENGSCTAIESFHTGPKRGDACTANADCAPDLVCGTQDVCTTYEGGDPGDPCGLTVDCKASLDLVCNGNLGICTVDGTGGTSCTVDGDCDPSWKCSGGTCVFPGTYALGDSCKDFTDCRKPLVCAVTSGTCEKLPFYAGVDCTMSDEELGAFRVYVEIPPPDDEIDALLDVGEPFEFYRLPFPNDIRREDTRIHMTGHPKPDELFGIDLVGLFLRAIEFDGAGYATNAPVFFRLTDPPTNGSLCLDPGGIYPDLPTVAPEEPQPEPFCSGTETTVYLVNIDPDSPGYNQRVPVQMATGRDRGQFICQNWIGIGPLDGRPLAEDTTYAAILTTGLRDVRGDAPQVDRDMQRILQGDETLDQAVLDATQPLRDWLADSSVTVDPTTIAAATVFTTGIPSDMGAKLATAVEGLTGADAPAFNSDAVSCEAPSAVSPCDVWQGCPASPASAYWHIEGTYSAPIFQKGTRPYLTDSFGGNLSVDQSGNPRVEGTETMCYALTIPKSGSGPWPVVIYAHGTGGSYNSFTADPAGIVDVFTSLGFAVIGFDNVMHGPRQDPRPKANWDPGNWEVDDPGNLFFNIVNPRAARDNILQGAADLFSLTRALKEATPYPLDGTGSAGAADDIDVEFDTSRIYFFGHSQGTVIAPAFLAETTDIRAAVISGAGAELALSILNKKEPIDIASMAGAFFGDQNLSRVHPMMGILATVFGRADAVNYAPHWVLDPPTGRTPMPILQFSGVGDSFTPDVTQWSLMRAGGIPIVETTTDPAPMPPEGVATADSTAAPVADNVNGTTLGAIQLAPDAAYDGHFVVFQHGDSATILSDFFSSAQAGAAEIQR